MHDGVTLVADVWELCRDPATVSCTCCPSPSWRSSLDTSSERLFEVAADWRVCGSTLHPNPQITYRCTVLGTLWLGACTERVFVRAAPGIGHTS